MPTYDLDKILSPEEKQSIVDQRRKSWAADLYGHILNKEGYEGAGAEVPADTVAAIAQLSDALAGTDAVKAAVDIEVEEAKRP